MNTPFRHSDEIAGDAAFREIASHSGRRLYITSRDRNATHEFAIDSEPLLPVYRRVADPGTALAGLNQLANPDFVLDQVPWKIASTAARDCAIGRDFSNEWTLEGGSTAFLSGPSQDDHLAIEYVSLNGTSLLPVLPETDYLFEGYFGSHRCSAAVIVESVDRRGQTLHAFRTPIGAALGGRSLEKYAHVRFPVRFDASVSYVRLRFVVEKFAADGSARSFLFFTNLAFGCRAVGERLGWRKSPLTYSQHEELSRGSWLIVYGLPHWRRDSIDGACLSISSKNSTGVDTGGQLDIPASSITFEPHTFDGVVLTGNLFGLEETEELELLIDGYVSNRIRIQPQAGKAQANIALRVANDHLDGLAHILELREVSSGHSLFNVAEILPALVTPWDMLESNGRPPMPFQVRPLVRERYRNLSLRVQALSELTDSATAEQVRVALEWTKLHKVLTGPDAWPSRPPMRIEAPHVEAPLVSIIIHGAPSAEIARRCIASVLVAHTDLSFEIIIVDDQSAGLAEGLQHISGLRIIYADRPSPSGLLNRAVDEARGPFVAFLDALAEPFARWLDELHLTFTLFENVAVVGSKILGSNGRLRTLGRLLSSSGEAHEARSGPNPEHPQNSYARQVDALSSAAMMLSRDRFLASGGFNSFTSRDLMDIDLSLSLTSDGGKAVVVPNSTICLHDEPRAAPISHASPTHDAMDPVFRRKWLDWFSLNGVSSKPSARDLDRHIFRRVLVADLQVPRADVDGGSYAAVQEIRLLQALGFKVTFLSMNLMHLGVYTQALQRVGVEVIYAPFAATVEDAVAERAGEFDAVYITRYNVAKVLLPTVRKHNPKAKVILNVADLHFLRELRAGLAAKNPEIVKRSRATRDTELEVLKQVDLALTYNDVEQGIIVSHTFETGKVAKAPWVVRPREIVPPHAARRNIAFVGSFGHHPNGEAVAYFVREVMPLLRERLPELNFLIYGSQMTPDVRAFATPGIQVIGYVDDLAAVYDQVVAIIAPLQSGAGIKAKVLEAMANGVPTVLSAIAAEGLGARQGVDYLGARTPLEWVDTIVTLVSEPLTWEKLSSSALDLVRQNYSFERGVQTMRAALEAIDIFTPNKPQALCYRSDVPPLV